MRTPRTPAVKQHVSPQLAAYIDEKFDAAIQASNLANDKLDNRLRTLTKQLTDANKRIDELDRLVTADHAKDAYRFSRAAFVRLGKELGFIQ
jgi:hypothetical protein